MQDDWIHTEILSDEDKKDGKKGSFVTFSMAAMLIVAIILLVIAFRGLFLPGGHLEEEVKDKTKSEEQSAPPADEIAEEETKKEEKKSGVEYIVQAGDTLSLIAEKYQVDWEEIAAANNLEAPYSIAVGQKLIIPGITEGIKKEEAKEKDAPAEEKPVTGGKTYTVEAGDTLALIGEKLGVDWKEIAAANDLTEPYEIYIGQKLVIPQDFD